MGNQNLHGSATTTQRTRKAIQESKEGAKKLSQRYGINKNTAEKWKKRDFTHDLKPGPGKGYGSSISPEEEAVICEVRRLTELPLDNLLVVLSDFKPNLSRSSLHRCLQRNNLSSNQQLLPKPERKKFQPTSAGFLDIDTREINVPDGRVVLYVAIDRVTKLCYVEVLQDRRMQTTQDFLARAVEFFPYPLHTILADNDSEFTDLAQSN